MDYNLAQKTFFDSYEVYFCKYAAAQIAQMALLKEVTLSPKPGLVDLNNCGSHRDMNLQTFMRSIAAISPWLDQFYLYGKSITVEDKFLPNLRPLGIQCELSMFKATNNVNTHKGGVFAFGLLLAAIGKLDNDQIALSYQTICDEVAKACQGLVQQELETRNSVTTVGERLFKQHRLTGARGEAESGYLTVRNISLPIFKEMMITGHDEETSLLQAMLYLLAYNNDTNLVSRGGMAGLQYVQDAAKSIIAIGGMIQQGGKEKLLELDQQLIKRNLSPGGTADLIAITWFLSQFN